MNFSKLFNFITRHLVWVILALVGFIFLWTYYGEFFWQYLAVLIMGIIGEAMALFLSGVAVFAFTKIAFTRNLTEGEDKKLDNIEKLGKMIVIAAIFVAVHILISTIIGGLYIAQFNK